MKIQSGTRENIEAAQAAADKKRSDFLSTLSESDKAKFIAVEQAVKLIAGNKGFFQIIIDNGTL